MLLDILVQANAGKVERRLRELSNDQSIERHKIGHNSKTVFAQIEVILPD